jgi:hypothetical protein
MAAVANDGTEAEPTTAPTRRAKARLENELFKTVPLRTGGRVLSGCRNCSQGRMKSFTKSISAIASTILKLFLILVSKRDLFDSSSPG